MDYEQTAAWWDSTAPDGRRHAEIPPVELMKIYGGVAGNAWSKRRQLASQKFGDQVVFPSLPTGRAATPREPVRPVPSGAVDKAELQKLLRKGGQTIVSLADHFDVGPSRVQAAIDELKAQHLILRRDGDTIALGAALEPEAPIRIDSAQFVEVEFPIGWVADTHLCSKYARMDVLEDLYDRFAAAGVTDVYHGGNWIDGEARFNQFDIFVHGCEDQVAYFVDHYPRRPGIRTHIVSGDDHEGWYVQREHVNVGHLLEDVARRHGRDDLIDLGYMERDLVFAQPYGESRLRVIHAGGGSSYAVSYTSQKYVETLQGGEKPHIVLVGHFHKYDWADPREVDVIQMMCTQDQTPFMRKRRLQAHVGGGIAWIRQNELGIFTSVKVQKFRYYNQAFYQHHWQRPATAGGQP